MFRSACLAAALCAAAACLSPGARADAPLPEGNYLLTTGGQFGDSAVCILKVAAKDGSPAVSVAYSLPNTETSISGFKATDGEVSFTVKQVQTFKGAKGKEQKFTRETVFVGVRGKDPKEVLGSIGNDPFVNRAKLAATDKETLEAKERLTRGPGADVMQKAQELLVRPARLRFDARQEKDAEKKKELLKQADEAAKEADEKVPALYRQVVEKFPDAPAAIDAATSLLTSAPRLKVTPEEGAKLVAVVREQSAHFGPRYVRSISLRTADAMVAQKALAAAALPLIEPVAKGLTDADKADFQFDVLTTYRAALAAAGKADQAKAVDARLAKLDAKLDEEYLARVPPFKPEKFAGRKEKTATRVAVMELFTGAQCPPCVAADVAFDALAKSYKPTDLVLIQYHLHIPGPDPMTNHATEARAEFYGVNSTPSTFFNGKRLAGGGGGMANAEEKFAEYRGIIDPLLEDTTTVKVGGKATRAGDRLAIAVEVDGLESTDNLRLRLLVVEDLVKYVGGNRLRFHHHVVRAMPGGAEGVAVKEKSFRHSAGIDIPDVRKDLTKYLDDYAANERPFPKPDRPMDMKQLKVIALVQNDKTKEILQAVQIEVDAKSAGGE